MQFLKYLVSRKNQTNKQIQYIKENIIKNFSWARQGLILLLRISIRNGQSGLHSSLKTIWKKDLKNILNFWEVNPTRTWPCSYVFPFRMKNQGSCSSK